jgi:hypothetical protein
VFYIDYKENRSIGVLAKNFVDLYVMSFEGVTRSVPSDELLSLTDLNQRMGTLRIISNIASW